MRIAYLSNSPIPSRAANGVHVMKMAEAFARRGHDVVLLAPARAEVGGPAEDTFEFYGAERIFRIQRIPSVSLFGRDYPYGLLAALWIARDSPDLVYGRYLPGLYPSAMLGVRTVYDSHGPARDLGRVHGWMFERLLQRDKLERIIVTTEALQTHYADVYGLQGRKVVVAPNGADPLEDRDIQPPRLRPPPSEGKITAGYLGHLYRGKGMSLIARLARRSTDVEYHVIGGTDEDVRRWREETASQENLHLHGYLPHHQARVALRSFDVLLAPYQREVGAYGGDTHSSRWTSPLKIFEYMATGKPILCSDFPTFQDILTHEETALLCSADEPKEWEAALHRLGKDPELGVVLGTNAQEVFLDRYTWAARARRVLDGLEA